MNPTDPYKRPHNPCINHASTLCINPRYQQSRLTSRITLKQTQKESPNASRHFPKNLQTKKIFFSLNIFLINFFKKYPNVYLKTFLSNIKFNVLKTNLKKTIIKKTLVSQHRNIEKFKIKHHEKRN